MGNNKFQIFKNECLKFQKAWGLSDWELTFHKEKMDSSIYAMIYTNIKGKTACLAYDVTKKDSNPKREAKHEMIHLVLAELSDLAHTRFTTYDRLYSAEEGIVRRLEKLL